jgi:hypothetical protein
MIPNDLFVMMTYLEINYDYLMMMQYAISYNN